MSHDEMLLNDESIAARKRQLEADPVVKQHKRLTRAQKRLAHKLSRATHSVQRKLKILEAEEAAKKLEGKAEKHEEGMAKLGEPSVKKRFVPPEIKPEYWEKINSFPDPRCKKCHGMGTLGWNHTKGGYNFCKCIKQREEQPTHRVYSTDGKLSDPSTDTSQGE